MVDLSSDMPPAVVHREFFGHDGAFRAGPQDAKFDRRFGTLARTTDPAEARRLAEEINRYCSELSKALFLCAPQALYAVNRHVDFKAYRATFELADTEVDRPTGRAETRRDRRRPRTSTSARRTAARRARSTWRAARGR